MPKYIAFLRGINVGGRSLKMTELKSCFEELGFTSVTTLLQTGNVIFETSTTQPDLKATIENELVSKFHFPIKVQILSFDKLKDIVAESPFSPDDNNHRYVVFFENDLEKQLMNEATEIIDSIETVRIGDSVIYWRVPIGLTLKSGFAKYLTKTKYKNFNTIRNIKTLYKLINP